mmetsp:Transcript_8990/g.33922  ORF Transcript_8990/g.33922 Transcript_8990/m.33922 type:complete len:401 (+) Transcript_8990:1298-2500(+)|eukprot:scaffold2730_cov247-Pinguiococcus_pyrenoidosus.AAC.18
MTHVQAHGRACGRRCAGAERPSQHGPHDAAGRARAGAPHDQSGLGSGGAAGAPESVFTGPWLRGPEAYLRHVYRRRRLRFPRAKKDGRSRRTFHRRAAGRRGCLTPSQQPFSPSFRTIQSANLPSCAFCLASPHRPHDVQYGQENESLRPDRKRLRGEKKHLRPLVLHETRLQEASRLAPQIAQVLAGSLHLPSHEVVKRRIRHIRIAVVANMNLVNDSVDGFRLLQQAEEGDQRCVMLLRDPLVHLALVHDVIAGRADLPNGSELLLVRISTNVRRSRETHVTQHGTISEELSQRLGIPFQLVLHEVRGHAGTKQELTQLKPRPYLPPALLISCPTIHSREGEVPLQHRITDSFAVELENWCRTVLWPCTASPVLQAHLLVHDCGEDGVVVHLRRPRTP